MIVHHSKTSFHTRLALAFLCMHWSIGPSRRLSLHRQRPRCACRRPRTRYTYVWRTIACAAAEQAAAEQRSPAAHRHRLLPARGIMRLLTANARKYSARHFWDGHHVATVWCPQSTPQYDAKEPGLPNLIICARTVPADSCPQSRLRLSATFTLMCADACSDALRGCVSAADIT